MESYPSVSLSAHLITPQLRVGTYRRYFRVVILRYLRNIPLHCFLTASALHSCMCSNGLTLQEPAQRHETARSRGIASLNRRQRKLKFEHQLLAVLTYIDGAFRLIKVYFSETVAPITTNQSRQLDARQFESPGSLESVDANLERYSTNDSDENSMVVRWTNLKQVLTHCFRITIHWRRTPARLCVCAARQSKILRAAAHWQI